MTEPIISTNPIPAPTPEPKPSSLPIIILSVLVVFALAGMGFLYWQNQQLQSQLTNISSAQSNMPNTTTPTTAPSLAIDTTTGWKTYSNSTYKYSFKYPADYDVFVPGMGGQDINTVPGVTVTNPKAKYSPTFSISLIKGSGTLEQQAQTYYQRVIDASNKVTQADKDASLKNLSFQTQSSVPFEDFTQTTFNAYPGYKYGFEGSFIVNGDMESLVPSEKHQYLWLTVNKNNYLIDYTENADMSKILSTLNFSSKTNTNSEWSTFQSKLHTLTISHPTAWAVKDTQSEVTLAKGTYTITISFPESFGPDICIFSDSPDYLKNLPNSMANKCAGEYVTISSSPREIRRLSQPALSATDAGWAIYTQSDTPGWFSTVPPITYTAPKNYDKQILQTMDQITSTLKVIPTVNTTKAPGSE